MAESLGRWANAKWTTNQEWSLIAGRFKCEVWSRGCYLSWLITLRHTRPPIVCGIFDALRVWMAGDRYDVATLEQALSRLGPALEILDGFTYRNKNQHRLSKWWAQLDMLRRGTRKLSLDLQDSVRDRPSQGKKRKKRAVGEAVDQKLDLRARHLRAQIVPRSYL